MAIGQTYRTSVVPASVPYIGDRLASPFSADLWGALFIRVLVLRVLHLGRIAAVSVDIFIVRIHQRV